MENFWKDFEKDLKIEAFCGVCSDEPVLCSDTNKYFKRNKKAVAVLVVSKNNYLIPFQVCDDCILSTRKSKKDDQTFNLKYK